MGAKHSTNMSNDEVKDDIPSAVGDSSGNNMVNVQEQRPIDVPIVQGGTPQPENSRGRRPPEVVDTAGCGCMDVYACSEGRLQGVQRDMRTESTIIKCQCKQPCTCVPPCECTKTDSIPVKSSWSVPHIFTKTTDLEKRLEDIEVQLKHHDKRIETLETISKQMTDEYVPLSAIPYCTHCKTIVLNGQVCDCGLIVP